MVLQLSFVFSLFRVFVIAFLSSYAAVLAASPPLAGAERGQSPSTVRVAAVQFISQWAKPAENRKALEPLVREAAKRGAKIVVLPETAVTAYMSHDLRRTWQVDARPLTRGLQGVSPEGLAETVPGESTRVFGALAKELGIYLTVPLVEVDPKQRKHFNTIVLVDPQGRIALHYRKLNPWPWAEQGWASPGDRGHQFLDTPYGRLGLLVCYDVNVIGANWSVPQRPQWYGYGQSLIIRRTGEVVSKVKSDLASEIIYADLPIPVNKPKEFHVIPGGDRNDPRDRAYYERLRAFVQGL